MNITQLAADIAARVPAMAKDTPLNNAELIEGLIRQELTPVMTDIVKTLQDLRRDNESALNEIREIREQLTPTVVTIGGSGGPTQQPIISPQEVAAYKIKYHPYQPEHSTPV